MCIYVEANHIRQEQLDHDYDGRKKLDDSMTRRYEGETFHAQKLTFGKHAKNFAEWGQSVSQEI